MSKPMERAEAEQILREEAVGRLGLCRDGVPYVVPLNYAYHNGEIFFHGAPRGGRKIDCLKANKQACFSVDRVEGMLPHPDPCRYNFRFRSVLAEGIIGLVENPAEKLAGLRLLVEKYGGPGAAEALTAAAAAGVLVFKLAVRELSGRRGGAE